MDADARARSRSPDSSRRRHAHIQTALTALLLVAAVTLGGAQGGQGMRGDLVCQLLTLPLLAWLLLRWRWDSLPAPLPKYAVAILLLPLLLPLLQWLPMPLAGWANNDQRNVLAAELASAGIGFRSHVSLVPYAAERALWSLLPAIALALSVLYLPTRAQRQLLGLFLALAVLGLLWGIVQRAQGPESILRLYPFTNLTDATGFFANRNHLASQLLMALPMVIALAAWLTNRRLAGEQINPALLLSSLALAVFVILGIALTRSRAGVLLSLVGMAACLPMLLALRRQRGQRRVLTIVAGVGLLLSLHFAWSGIAQRMHRNPLEDSRWGFAELTSQAAQAHAPLGSGLGSFRSALSPFDVVSPSARIVQHAHNDWLELWLEGGLPFLLLAGGFLLFFVWAGVKVWRPGSDDALLLRTRAAWIGLTLALLHAVVDYALRTTANMVVFGLLMAVLLTGLAKLQEPVKSRRRPGSARS